MVTTALNRVCSEAILTSRLQSFAQAGQRDAQGKVIDSCRRAIACRRYP